MARGTRSSRRLRQQAVEEMPSDELDVQIDDEDSGSSASSRRSSRRSSARGSARGASARGSTRDSRKGSKKKTRTSKAGDGGGDRGSIVKIVVIVLVLGVLGGGGYVVYDRFLKEEPIERKLDLLGDERVFVGTMGSLARQFWDEARDQQGKVEKALQYKNEDVAQVHLDALTVLLHRPEIGGGKLKPNPEDTTIGDFQLALKAAVELPKLEGYQARIISIRNDKAAELNYSQLQKRLTTIVQLDDQQLDRLQNDIERFTQNPVSPDAGPDLANQQTYKSKIRDLDSRLYEITVERLRRLMKNTTDVVEAINRESQKLIQQDRYEQALRMVDDAIASYPDAKLEPVRSKVITSARESWSAAKTLIEAKITAAKSQGNSEALREAARLEAISKLERVIERYGSEASETRDYVSEAERMLSEFRN